jgi:RNA-directed DNA polymerase
LRHLYGLLTEGLLTESGRASKQPAASGVDQRSAQDYEPPLEGKSRGLGERLQQKRDRAPLGKRPSIPKGKGQRRPLGLPAVEAKRLQGAATRRREALYEQDGRRGRYGSRPGVGAWEAIDKRTVKLPCGRYP